MPPEKISVTVNGSAMELREGETVADLLKHLEIDSLLVAVELNLNIVSKSKFSDQKIVAGDRLEIVHFVGGG